MLDTLDEEYAAGQMTMRPVPAPPPFDIDLALTIDPALNPLAATVLTPADIAALPFSATFSPVAPTTLAVLTTPPTDMPFGFPLAVEPAPVTPVASEMTPFDIGLATNPLSPDEIASVAYGPTTYTPVEPVAPTPVTPVDGTSWNFGFMPNVPEIPSLPEAPGPFSWDIDGLLNDSEGGHAGGYQDDDDGPTNAPSPSSTGTVSHGGSYSQPDNWGGYDSPRDGYGDGISGEALAPVLLDLSGGGLNVNSLSSSSQFVDINGDGYEHRAAWAGDGTGVLVFDADGDGKISNSKEFVFTEWDASAAGDLEAIRDIFDSNVDGKLDSGDAQWSKFKVMVNGQLVSLTSLGITSIDLTAKGSGQTISDGSVIAGTTTYTKSDGTIGAVGDAVLASDSNGYIVKSSVVTNADHSTTDTILASNADGSLAFENLVTTSADGNTVQTKFDDDGNGTYDRSQTDVTTIASTGIRTRVVSDFNADGSLVTSTTTVSSADQKTVTTTVDQDGDGKVDQSQIFVTNSDGSTMTTTKEVSAAGTLLQQTLVQASADGLSKTTKTDINGDGTYDDVVSDATVFATDGSRTRTIKDSSANGTLLSNIVTATSSDNRAKTVTSDLDGNGTVDEREQTQITIAANGDVTTVVTTTNGDNSARGKTTTVATANGLSTTVSTDLTGDSVADRVDSDVTTIAADGSRTETVQETSASGVLLSKSVTTTSADGKTKSISVDANGDGATDALTSITVGTDGSISETDSALNPNGTVVAKTLTTTTADGLSKTISQDLNGDGAYDVVTSDVIAAASGGRTETVTIKSASGATLSKTVTTTSADSLNQTALVDINGDGVNDQSLSDTIVLGTTGTRQETVATKSGNGTLEGQIVTLISADRKTTTVTTDSDGDGHTDSTAVQGIATSGTQTTTTTSTSANGALHAKTVETISADGLTTTTVSDVNGDGVNDLTSVDQTVVNADRSQTETLTIKSSNGTLLNKTTTTVTGNGLSTTVQADSNGDGVIDAKSVKASTLNSDGSTTTDAYDYAGTTQIDRTKTQVSANRLVTRTDYNFDGNATVDRTLISTKTLNADGSISEIDTVTTASGGLLSKTTNTASADSKSLSSQVDLDGNGINDIKTTAVIDATGKTTRTTETYKAGTTTLSSRATTVTSANGLSVTTSSDLDGNGVYEQTVSDVTTLNLDGSRTEAVTRSSNTAPIEQTKITTSASGLSKTTVVSADIAGVTARNEIYRLYLGILGRNPDVAGFSSYTKQFNSGTTAVQLASILVGSPEFSTKYGTLDNTQFVTQIYQNGLGRAPDAGGLNTWVTALNSGTSRASVAQQIIDSTEGQSHTASAVAAWALNNPSVVLAAVETTTDVTTLNADGSTTEVVTGTGLSASKTTTTVSAHGTTTTVTSDIDGNGVVDQKSVTTHNADGSTTQVLSDLTSTGTTSHSKTNITSADGLSRTVNYDTDGNGVANKSYIDTTVLNANGSTTTTEHVNVVNSAGTLVAAATTQTDKSADGLTITTKWDQTGSGAFTKSETDATVLNADGSRTRTVSYYTGTTLTSRYLTKTSANGLSITTQSDLTGAGSYSEIATDVTVINADGTKTRTVSSTKADGTVISKFVTTTNADGLIVTTNEQRTGLATQNVSDTIENLADGAIRETVATTDSTGKLIGKTITVTSADKLTVTIDRDANGDGVVDQHQQTITAASGAVTSTVTDYKSSTVVADKSTTTTSANGLQTTINWDLDGNGTNDRTRVETDAYNADGSQSHVISDTDLATGKLATKTTIQLSSDGTVRTTSKDVNGDGTVDQVETVTADTTGASVSILTNTTTARATTYLLAGKVYWKQAIAAKVETDSSADGHSKTIKYDYDGNGTFDTILQSQLQIDGSVVTTVSETNTSGAIVAKGTITTSADGLVTILSKDSNNDGVIDHTETAITHADGSITLTKVDRNTSGTVTQTVVDTVSALGSLTLRTTTDGQGRKTSQMAIASNGTSVATTYDAASGQTLSVTNANKAGIVTSAVLYDPLKAQPWTRVEQTFDATGKKSLEKQFMDDGTRTDITFDVSTGNQKHIDYYNAAVQRIETIDYDLLNTAAWSRVQQNFDTSGRVTYRAEFNDNGTETVYNYDPSNTVGWSTYLQQFNAAGQLTSIDQTNDDGTRFQVLYDPTNVQTWTRVEKSLDANGHLSVQSNFNDDGTRTSTTYDYYNAQPWSSIKQVFDAAGRLTTQYNYNDDGSQVKYAFDPTNVQTWSSTISSYDPAGQLTWKQVLSDTAGDWTTTYYDTTNSQPWTSVAQTFTQSRIFKAKSYNDDGSWTNFQYDSNGNNIAWQRYVPTAESPGYRMVDQYPPDDGSSHGNRPVLLDLNGDGHIDLRPLDLTAVATGSGPSFDWNEDGVRDGTAWVGPQDGFLAIDLGSGGQAGADGLIDQSKELAFSEWADPEQIAANGGSVSDLDGLRLAFDSNHDNVLDANDARWDEFRVWRDSNQNGVSDAGELETMSEAGIKLINLMADPSGAQSFSDGSSIAGTSTYQSTDGTTYMVGDASLVSHPAIPASHAA